MLRKHTITWVLRLSRDLTLSASIFRRHRYCVDRLTIWCLVSSMITSFELVSFRITRREHQAVTLMLSERREPLVQLALGHFKSTREL